MFFISLPYTHSWTEIASLRSLSTKGIVCPDNKRTIEFFDLVSRDPTTDNGLFAHLDQMTAKVGASSDSRLVLLCYCGNESKTNSLKKQSRYSELPLRKRGRERDTGSGRERVRVREYRHQLK